MAQLFYEGKEVIHRSETNVTLAKRSSRDDLGLQFVLLTEEHRLAHSYLSAGTNKTLPFVRVAAGLASQQNLDTSPQKVMRRRIVRTERLSLRSGAATIKPRGKDAGVVHHQ